MTKKWLYKKYNYRLLVTVNVLKLIRYEKPVEIKIDIDKVNKQINKDVFRDKINFKIIEVDNTGKIVDNNISCQFDFGLEHENEEKEIPVLTFIMKKSTSKRRFFEIYFTEKENFDGNYNKEEYIKITSEQYRGQKSYKINTPAATYYFHQQGAGFAGIIDREGNDWIGHNLAEGSAGQYRGIPNLIYPEGDFHPGAEGSESRIITKGPIKVSIYSETEDNNWACRWDIFPAYARLKVLKVAHPYWFLYEGTPGGDFQPEIDYCVLSSGERYLASKRWARKLMPRWLYFGDGNSNRVIYLIHHEDEEGIVDSYWPMEGNMTVFGFGRNDLEKYLKKTPAQFTIGLAEIKDQEQARELINSIYYDYEISINGIEKNLRGE